MQPADCHFRALGSRQRELGLHGDGDGIDGSCARGTLADLLYGEGSRRYYCQRALIVKLELVLHVQCSREEVVMRITRHGLECQVLAVLCFVRVREGHGELNFRVGRHLLDADHELGRVRGGAVQVRASHRMLAGAAASAAMIVRRLGSEVARRVRDQRLGSALGHRNRWYPRARTVAEPHTVEAVDDQCNMACRGLERHSRLEAEGEHVFGAGLLATVLLMDRSRVQLASQDGQRSCKARVGVDLCSIVVDSLDARLHVGVHGHGRDSDPAGFDVDARAHLRRVGIGEVEAEHYLLVSLRAHFRVQQNVASVTVPCGVELFGRSGQTSILGSGEAGDRHTRRRVCSRQGDVGGEGDSDDVGSTGLCCALSNITHSKLVRSLQATDVHGLSIKGITIRNVRWCDFVQIPLDFFFRHHNPRRFSEHLWGSLGCHRVLDTHAEVQELLRRVIWRVSNGTSLDLEHKLRCLGVPKALYSFI